MSEELLKPRAMFSRISSGVFSKDSLQFLPFSEEPFSAWTKRNDLFRYLYSLCNKESVMVDGKGMVRPVNYASHADYLYETNIKRVAKEIVDFSKCLMARAESPNTHTVDLQNHACFGLMGKHIVAWDATLDAILSEGAFFSLAHVLESEHDLESSILLAKGFFYKQALQVLRNYIEDIVLQLYFCDERTDFSKWQSGSFRIPRLRGKGGMLETLLARSRITREMYQIGSELYNDLNGAVHGAEKRLIHQGLFEGKHTGHTFNMEKLEEWCRYFSRCVDLGIRALQAHVEHWESVQSQDAIECPVCRTEGSFDAVRYTFAARAMVQLKCRRCGNTVSYLADSVAHLGY